MKRILLVLVLALVAVSCKTTRLIDTWVPREYTGAPYERLMIVGLNPTPAARAQYENDFVDKLSNYGVISVASINLVPGIDDIDRKEVASWIAKYNLDGVLVTRVTTTKPPRHYVPPHVSLGGWYGTWAYDSEMVGEKEKFWVETGLFDAKTEELRYSAVLKTKIKHGLTKTIHAVIDRLAADMLKRGYFKGR